MKALIYLPVIAASLLLGLNFFAPQDTTVTPTHAAQAPTETASASSNFFQPTRTQTAKPTAGINSLRDTEVDGVLETDVLGNLVVNEGLRHLFDYFFTAVGEIEFDQAAERIRQYLADQLEEPALSQAQAVLDAYINYKTELVELERNFPVLADISGLRDREDAVQRLRATLFSRDVHEAFFTNEE
ncbi:MAG: lipase secretion chaperone, partial [Pseudomonas sp.]